MEFMTQKEVNFLNKYKYFVKNRKKNPNLKSLLESNPPTTTETGAAHPIILAAIKILKINLIVSLSKISDFYVERKCLTLWEENYS